MENQPKLNSKEIIVFLAKRFPLCFTAEGTARPLKIGIFQDVVERVQKEMTLSKTQLRSALRLYTSSWRYLHGIKVGAQRIDLDGKPCGALDEQHEEYARTQLREAKARVKKQRTEQQVKKHETLTALNKNTGLDLLNVQHCQIASDLKKQELPQQSQQHKPEVKKKKAYFLPVMDISKLQVGQDIKVMAGKNSMKAIILEIAKDGVRVQLSSGLSMIVRAEHLQF